LEDKNRFDHIALLKSALLSVFFLILTVQVLENSSIFHIMLIIGVSDGLELQD
jgi:hypothetical protein